MAHDFIKFPELTNRQMDIYYFDSPHKQILEDFRGKCIKVIDGDTIRVECDFRDFSFPVRLIDINAPEMSEGGEEAKSWLESKILNEEVEILINPKLRVGKWGRILGTILHGGVELNDEIVRVGLATPFDQRDEGQIPNLNKELSKIW